MKIDTNIDSAALENKSTRAVFAHINQIRFHQDQHLILKIDTQDCQVNMSKHPKFDRLSEVRS